MEKSALYEMLHSYEKATQEEGGQISVFRVAAGLSSVLEYAFPRISVLSLVITYFGPYDPHHRNDEASP